MCKKTFFHCPFCKQHARVLHIRLCHSPQNTAAGICDPAELLFCDETCDKCIRLGFKPTPAQVLPPIPQVPHLMALPPPRTEPMRPEQMPIAQRVLCVQPPLPHPFRNDLADLGYIEPEAWTWWRSNPATSRGYLYFERWTELQNGGYMESDWPLPLPYELRDEFLQRIRAHGNQFRMLVHHYSHNDLQRLDNQFSWRENFDPHLRSWSQERRQRFARNRRENASKKPLAIIWGGGGGSNGGPPAGPAGGGVQTGGSGWGGT